MLDVIQMTLNGGKIKRFAQNRACAQRTGLVCPTRFAPGLAGASVLLQDEPV
jgi:hypothetical protein